MPTLDKSQRLEVAHAVWQLFCLMAEKADLFFTEEGVSITVKFVEKHQLGDGTRTVGAVVRGFHDYTEVETGALVALPNEHDS